MVQSRLMRKFTAIQLLGGSAPAAAKTLGVSTQAVHKWPDPLPLRISDRVLGAYSRIHLPDVAQLAAPQTEEKEAA
jgi:hypothetical protein